MRVAGLVEARRGRTRRASDDLATLSIGPEPISVNAPAVHVDHRHEAGRVPGVRCFNCNSAVGKLGDDPDTPRRAVTYPEGNAWKPTLVAPGVCRLPS
ncbi:endonuclease domain-containing protein [Streptomyces sp. NPDC057302]|uniref:endonuclease domain-containing protein n=1 Tax=Streptomyces sp. NPDC057302 TaxID=3346094 RepID=UPI003641653A